MDPVKVKVADLLSAITKNRETHVKEATEAAKGYQTAVIAKCEEALAKLKGKDMDANDVRNVAYAVHGMPIPEDHRNEYDLVIKMLSMSTEEVIEIDENDFNKFVCDNWEWSRQAKFVNTAYLSTK